MGNIIESSVSSIRSRKYNRYDLSDEDGIKKIIETSLSKKSSLKFLNYWGADKKKYPDKAEIITLDFIADWKKRIDEVYPFKTQFHFLFSDTHAKINGHNSNLSFKSMEKILFDYGHTFEYIGDSVLLQYKLVSASKSDIEKAKKHALGNPVIAAQKYNAQRYEENKYIEHNFSNYIFCTFNGPMDAKIHPRIPTLYLYSKKGYCEAPWHITIW